jgi:Xaa-Pro aminopeptidase
MFITDHEFDTRIARVRADLMEPRQIDLLLIYADDVFRPGGVRYLTNFDVYANYAMAMLSASGELALAFGMHHPVYLVRAKEVARANYLRGTKTPADLCQELLAERGARHPRIGMVGCSAMFQCMRADLDALLPDASFSDVSLDFERMRAVKSSAELMCLKRSRAIAAQIQQAAKALVRPGMTELQLIAEAGVAGRRAGADVLTREMIRFRVAGGKGALSRLRSASDRILQEGDIFAIEVAPEFEGYRSIVGRTYIVGSSTAEQRKQMTVVADIHDEVCASFETGLKISDIALEMERLLRKAGISDGQVFGHGIGIDIEEIPTLTTNDQTVVENGMSLAVKSLLPAPEMGAIFLADTIMVDSDGHT